MPQPVADPKPVKWPGNAYAADGDDLGTPVRDLLRGLRLLEDPHEEEAGVGALSGTPVTLQVMSSGATSLAKWWATIVAALGSAGVTTAAIRAWVIDPDNATALAVAIAAIAAVAAAVVLAIAAIVRADICGRATATAAEYQARARVTEALLTSFQYGRPAPAPPAPDAHYWVQTAKGWSAVRRFDWVNNGVVAVLADDKGTTVPSKDIRSLMPYPPNGASA